MPSAGGSEPLDLSRLVTTPEDVRALRAARERREPLSAEAWLRWLAALPRPSPEVLRGRRGPGGREPFRL